MTLFEVGIFQNSALLYSESFYSIEGNQNHDTHRRSHVVNLLSRMSERVYQSPATHIKAGNYQIFTATHTKDEENQENNYFLYTVGDKESDEAIMSKLLTILLRKIKSLAKDLNLFAQSGISTQQKRYLKQTVRETLEDERLKPNDRILRYVLL